MGKKDTCDSFRGWVEYFDTRVIKILGNDTSPIIRDFPSPIEKRIPDEKSNSEEQKTNTND